MAIYYVQNPNNWQYVTNVHHVRQIDAPRYISWSFPPSGYIKINVDGSFMPNSGLAGYGGIARDDRGRWLGGFVGRLGVVTKSCLTAELWAIHGGLTVAKNFNLTNVIIETDSKVALMLMIKREAVNNHPDCNVIEECRRLMLELGVSIMHTLRQGNNCADHLAKLGRMQQDEDLVILHRPPHSMHQLILADMAHVAYPRYPKHVR
ncbi:hypothetical protein KY290_004632 [Solanum tuberosum]|uniref:RNase H type-1 domain-containing protein n=1 Tax=Solanum tuberosum TaxID=4113 RepID=A0ABQ7WCB3_SOLTU|nr:hypothetical protein KY284_004747 [Solanum tuberosum]KAH0778205.1 hypothetical protein KY290_004632 [Solanum tuberosum]